MTVIERNIKSLLDGFSSQAEFNEQQQVEGFTLDSRHVKKGMCFIALATKTEQRVKHMTQAIENGCNAIMYDENLPLSDSEQLLTNVVNTYPVAELSDRTSEIAARFYGRPSSDMSVIAVTGTNGKTSVTQFVAQSLELLGNKVGVIGTLGVGRYGELKSTGMTTPDPIRVQAILAEMQKQGIKYVVVEASSHALEQKRLAAVDIDIAVFTNLSHDHLDYHQTMEAYGQAKQKLFEFESVYAAVINSDDAFGKSLLTYVKTNEKVKTLSYGKSIDSEDKPRLTATDIQYDMHGLTFSVNLDEKNQEFQTQLLGQFNVDNMLATMGVLSILNVPTADMQKVVKACKPVDGRMQAYTEKKMPTVVIDYAHTPDALFQVLQSLRAHIDAKGALWCVFGCGGDRDRAKRPVMGKYAETLSDRVVITNDNPRTESSEIIIADILAGMNETQNVTIEADRSKAIHYAIEHASELDIVLIAGKGHEDYQDIEGTKIPFSDVDEVTHALKMLNEPEKKTQEAIV
jgi:UDP-N-acetylmuramoyl-L-alanyl-D-glutamate--2,6-diaminopimelate ligase